MIASAPQNSEVRAESKSAMKKRAKAEALAAQSAASTPAVPESGADTPETANGDSSYESPYLKELYKSVTTVLPNSHSFSSIVGYFRATC